MFHLKEKHAVESDCSLSLGGLLNVARFLQLAEEGYHCYAPDWIGFGFSETPQPEYDFSYTGTLPFRTLVIS